MPETRDGATIALTSPITAHGEKVTELVLRLPKGKDIARLGLPIQSSDGGAGGVNTRVVADYLSELGGIPPSAVGELSAPDFMSATLVVISFFGIAPPQS